MTSLFSERFMRRIGGLRTRVSRYRLLVYMLRLQWVWVGDLNRLVRLTVIMD